MNIDLSVSSVFRVVLPFMKAARWVPKILQEPHGIGIFSPKLPRTIALHPDSL